jgi:hypothetical protein
LMWYIIAGQSAVKSESPMIFAKLNNLRTTSTEEIRLEAEARAKVWSEQNPVRAGE